MDRATSQQLIHPHRERIIRCCLNGHADVMREHDPAYLASLSPRSRFGCIWDRIKFHMLIEFGLTGPVRWAKADDNPQLEFLYIDGAPEGIALRPKKVDRFNAITANYPTDYEKSLRIEQYVMYGAEPPAHLFAAYTEDGNELLPSIERILITSEYRENSANQLDWWYELYRADDSGAIPFETGYDQPRLPGTGFAGKIKPKMPAKESDQPNRIRPTGSGGGSEQGKQDEANGDGQQRAEGGNG